MKIALSLNESSIQSAISDIKKYKTEFVKKVDRFVDRVAEVMAADMSAGFGWTWYDDLLNRGGRSPNVSVTQDRRGNVVYVIAYGEDAVFVEFGAGVFHNTPVGSSPHPKGAELGFTIGSYGLGNGAKSVWGYYENGEMFLTHGTAAQMPMYNALKNTVGKINQIAREVFE